MFLFFFFLRSSTQIRCGNPEFGQVAVSLLIFKLDLPRLDGNPDSGQPGRQPWLEDVLAEVRSPGPPVDVVAGTDGVGQGVGGGGAHHHQVDPQRVVQVVADGEAGLGEGGLEAHLCVRGKKKCRDVRQCCQILTEEKKKQMTFFI